MLEDFDVPGRWLHNGEDVDMAEPVPVASSSDAPGGAASDAATGSQGALAASSGTLPAELWPPYGHLAPVITAANKTVRTGTQMVRQRDEANRLKAAVIAATPKQAAVPAAAPAAKKMTWPTQTRGSWTLQSRWENG